MFEINPLIMKKKSIIIKTLGIFFFKSKGSVLNNYNSLISPTEIKFRNSNNTRIDQLISDLAPWKYKGEIDRYGGTGDGSYIIPTDLVNKKTILVSGGLGDNNNFEIQLARLGIKGFQIDNSISKPPKNHKNLNFVSKTLGALDDEESISLKTLIYNVPTNKAVIVKLDIEGGEIEALKNLPKNILQKITCLSMELHSISSIGDNNQILEMLKYLNTSGFRSIYLQANNGCLTYTMSGYLIPDNIEVTFVKKNKVTKPTLKEVRRIKMLQSKNNSDSPLVNIDHFLFYNV
jgi:hypothetical protein